MFLNLVFRLIHSVSVLVLGLGIFVVVGLHVPCAHTAQVRGTRCCICIVFRIGHVVFQTRTSRWCFAFSRHTSACCACVSVCLRLPRLCVVELAFCCTCALHSRYACVEHLHVAHAWCTCMSRLYVHSHVAFAFCILTLCLHFAFARHACVACRIFFFFFLSRLHFVARALGRSRILSRLRSWLLSSVATCALRLQFMLVFCALLYRSHVLPSLFDKHAVRLAGARVVCCTRSSGLAGFVAPPPESAVALRTTSGAWCWGQRAPFELYSATRKCHITPTRLGCRHSSFRTKSLACGAS